MDNQTETHHHNGHNHAPRHLELPRSKEAGERSRNDDVDDEGAYLGPLPPVDLPPRAVDRGKSSPRGAFLPGERHDVSAAVLQQLRRFKWTESLPVSRPWDALV